MLVEIDKTGRDHQAGCIHFQLATQRAGRDRGDLAASDADAAHGIQAGFGVHHAAMLQNDVVGLRGE